MRKKILLISTGGTIASRETEHGLVPGLPPEELLRRIPLLEEICDAETFPLLNIDSTNIQPEHWLLMAAAIRERWAAYDGFVVTHGTDTMAYTAAALSYLIQDSRKPIVLTGSQQPIGARGSDAERNLTDAFRYCCREDARDISVVFGGKVILGTRARKVKTVSHSAFESINFPLLAYINGTQVASYARAPISAPEPRFYDALDTNVFLLKLVPGMEPDILEYVARKAAAVVIESYGMGGLPFADRRNFLETVQALANKGKLIVLATQVMLEGSNLGVYEVGVRAAESAPMLQSLDMTGEAVVTKLMWILAQTTEFEEVKRLFYTPVNRDIVIPE